MHILKSSDSCEHCVCSLIWAIVKNTEKGMNNGSAVVR